MASPIISFHEIIFDYLYSYYRGPDKLLFLPRRRFRNRLAEGRYFIGYPNYLQVTFWSGGHRDTKLHGLGFLVAEDGTVSYTLRTKANSPDFPIFQKIAETLSGFTNHKPGRWSKELDGDDILHELDTFITEIKPRIDAIIASFDASDRFKLDEVEVEQAIERVLEYRNMALPDGHKYPPSGSQISTISHLRSVNSHTIIIDPLHKKIQLELLHLLSDKYEHISLEYKRMDLVGFSLGRIVDIYEIKTLRAKSAIRAALGQILEYGHYPEEQFPGRFCVVGISPPSDADRAYLKHLRGTYNIQLFYYYFNTTSNQIGGEA